MTLTSHPHYADKGEYHKGENRQWIWQKGNFKCKPSRVNITTQNSLVFNLLKVKCNVKNTFIYLIPLYLYLLNIQNQQSCLMGLKCVNTTILYEKELYYNALW